MTLLEMLVTVALLLLMMLIIVAVFQSATGAITTSRAYELLGQDLRRLDTVIRQDLTGVTCRMTPPLNPQENRGYFEYAENALSDAQDEDSDDTLRFTAQAPSGQPFVGRVWVPTSNTATGVCTLQPTTTTSQFAEIIYFLRGQKLYRRVLLILPQQQLRVGNIPMDPDITGFAANSGFQIRPNMPQRFGFATGLFVPAALFKVPGSAASAATNGAPFVSWLGMNDISARPSNYPISVPVTQPQLQQASVYTPTPNTLGDLTNRENRFCSPRFSNDFLNNQSVINGNPIAIPDGIPDDSNNDGVPDYYQTMYAGPSSNSETSGLLNDTFAPATNANVSYPAALRPLTADRTAFPFLYVNGYSQYLAAPGVSASSSNLGAIHVIDPSNTSQNHNALVDGDSLATPGAPQTWWAWPTYRDTMSPFWLDPIKRINDPPNASFFSDPIGSQETAYQQFRGLTPSAQFFLPPQSQIDQPFTDLTPLNPQNPHPDIFDIDPQNNPGFKVAPVFEDDLIADHVRSFNIKAYDPNARWVDVSTNPPTIKPLVQGYYDLGYGSFYNPILATGTPFEMLDTLGHEGRMPPLTADNRDDPQYPRFGLTDGIGNISTGLGDNNTGLARMRRIWDSWSTTYTNAPGLPVDPTLPGPLATNPNTGGGYTAVVPSYPAPYPVPLRGIQIQIRITDPDEKYVKVLTIQQDFSDKL